MDFAVETWAPDYGAPVDAAVLDESTATVDLAVERDADGWSPVDPAGAAPARAVLFVDGVQRIDARVWITDRGITRSGVCASWAAGVVRCDGRAEVVAAEVRRGVLCPGGAAEGIRTGKGDYRPYPVPENVGGDPVQQALGRVRGDLEGRVAVAARTPSRPLVAVAGPADATAPVGAASAGPADAAGLVGSAVPAGVAAGPAGPADAAGSVEQTDAIVPAGPAGPAAGAAGIAACAGPADGELLVVDGPLGDRRHIVGAVGYIKAHHVSYLPTAQQQVVAALRPGERTPLFAVGDRRFRYSWYLRLPGPATHPWWGIVRCEASGDLPREEAAAVANRVAATLPRFASQPHNDARAPQNLHPIAGLERELRRRLGDPLLLERALRRAAAS